jgi:hypothetical protein
MTATFNIGDRYFDNFHGDSFEITKIYKIYGLVHKCLLVRYEDGFAVSYYSHDFQTQIKFNRYIKVENEKHLLALRLSHRNETF